MNVVFVCYSDWANECYTISKALKTAGVNALTFVRSRHQFHHPEHGTFFKLASHIREHIKKADVVIYGFSNFFSLGVNLSNKLVAVLHGGSNYRLESERLNSIFNPIVDISLCGSDLISFGAKNTICVFSAVDSNLIQPVYSIPEDRKRIVGHFPSGSKGIRLIEPVIQKLQKEIDFEFRYSCQKLPFLKHIERISKCDIYIENLKPAEENIPFTTFGRSALEVSSLGKVVCTRFIDLDIYNRVIGPTSLQVTNNQKELERTLRILLTCSWEELIELQKQSRKWVEDYHSLESMGIRWKEIFERHLERKRARLRKGKRILVQKGKRR